MCLGVAAFTALEKLDNFLDYAFVAWSVANTNRCWQFQTRVFVFLFSLNLRLVIRVRPGRCFTTFVAFVKQRQNLTT